MGESLVESPKIENKMGESVTHIPCLQESVSFGRFEHDSLCWERWSTFPSNKYLEEVEKCSTPGSVAQKKAYFEAHYKRIAARKAELLEEEKSREAESGNLESQIPSSSVCNTSEEDLDVEKSITRDSGIELDEVGDFSSEVSDKHIDIPGSSIDILIEDDGVVNLKSEASEVFEENGAVNLSGEVNEDFEELETAAFTSQVSENFEGNETVNLTSDFCENFEKSGVANLTSEVGEIFDKSSDVDIIDEVVVLTGNEYDHIDGLNDEAEEKVKIQPELTYEPHNGADMVIECRDIKPEPQDIQPKPEDANQDLCLKIEMPELVKPDEPVLVKQVIASAQVWHDKEVLAQEKVEEKDIIEKETKKPVKLVDPVKTNKTTLLKTLTTDTTNVNKKPALANTKRPVTPTANVKRPVTPTANPKRPVTPTANPKRPGTPTANPKRPVTPTANPKRPVTPTTNPKRPVTPTTNPKRPVTPTTNPKRPVTPILKPSTISTPKSSTVSTPKSSTVSTPKPSDPELTKTAKSTVRPSLQKDDGFTPSTSKKAARPENKRILPSSLHMSLSYGPPNTDSASLPTMRKPLIMERMGDKDIVRRAFKSFKNAGQLSQSSLAEPTATSQPATRIEQKTSVPDTPQKKKEGTIRSAKVTTSAVISQQGTKKTLLSPGSKKNIGVDQRKAKAVPTSFGSRVPVSFGSRSQDLGRQQKLVPKRIEQKTTINAGITNLQSKIKAQKAAEIGKTNQMINSKTKLSTSYNQGHGFLRGSVRKENAKF